MRIAMRQIGACVAVAASVACGVGIAGAQSPAGGRRLAVTPSHGTPSTRFVVTFTATATTGTSGGSSRTITARVIGSSHATSACTNSRSLDVTVTHTGVQHVGFSPAGPGRWCAGTFRGVVEEMIRPVCTAGRACPDFIAVSQIGTFSFTVAVSAARAASGPTGPSGVLPVRPAVGTPKTTFRVRLPHVLMTGPSRTLDATVYLVRRRHGDCQAGAGEATGDVPDHIHDLVFSPQIGRWCAGRYLGSATVTISPACSPNKPCPNTVRVEPLGQFSFTVRRGG